MTNDVRNIDYFKALHLKQVGIALASIWVIVLIAAVAATIYREIDGPTVRSTISENLASAQLTNEITSRKLAAAEDTIDRIADILNGSDLDQESLRNVLNSYLPPVPSGQ
ncbi:MAG: hypothetical protein HQ475_12450 [SAR202 cluster bacterium]|nr:hypothetical protein [SAR202 cluster bacterium]